MSIVLQVFVIALALSADAMAVSLSAGTKLGSFRWKKALLMAFFFGLFQAVMPLIGWMVGHSFLRFIESWDHWLAGGLLAFIGQKMIFEAFSKDNDSDNKKDFFALGTLLVLSIATSIDAAAVGLSFSVLGVNGLQAVLCSAFGIGVVTFLLSFVSVLAGHNGAQVFGKKIEFVAGLILIAIGVKVVIEHLAAYN